MRWLSAYGTADKHLFAAVLAPQPYGFDPVTGERIGRINWGISRDDEIVAPVPDPEMQFPVGFDEVFGAYRQGWARPDLIVLGPGKPERPKGRCGSCIWRDDVLPDPYYVRNVSVQKFPQLVRDQHNHHGRFPMRVQAYGDHFAAVFVRDDLAAPYVTDQPVKRVWSVHRTKTDMNYIPLLPYQKPILAPFDEYVKDLMQHYNIRGGQLAIAAWCSRGPTRGPSPTGGTARRTRPIRRSRSTTRSDSAAYREP